LRYGAPTGIESARRGGAQRLIPVTVVTGFLGSGKTTLISRMLRDPALGRTAVIVNEFGEIGLDHDLIASSDDQVLTLNTGCLCCAVQTDLARTLMDLWQRRTSGTIEYDRVLIETSGLSDPAPVLQSMMSDASVSATHRLPYVVTLVDAIHGETTLRDHIEARHQVALADRILISKTDMVPSRVDSDVLSFRHGLARPGRLLPRGADSVDPDKRDPDDAGAEPTRVITNPVFGSLNAELNVLNHQAPRLKTIEATPADLFGETSITALALRLSRTPRRPAHTGIDTFTVIRDRPMPALALTLLLQGVAEHCGSRLLRLKGLVAIDEMPGRPAVIHGVRHVVSPPDFLDRWPSGDERTRIVFITTGMPRYFVSRLLDAIEEEVRDALAPGLSTSSQPNA
jgi:G3E family GTPase